MVHFFRDYFKKQISVESNDMGAKPFGSKGFLRVSGKKEFA
jgi:hypothetical protein